MRRVLNEAALWSAEPSVSVVVAGGSGVSTNPPLTPESYPQLDGRPFKPDFGSRLKKEGKR